MVASINSFFFIIKNKIKIWPNFFEWEFTLWQVWSFKLIPLNNYTRNNDHI